MNESSAVDKAGPTSRPSPEERVYLCKASRPAEISETNLNPTGMKMDQPKPSISRAKISKVFVAEM